MKVFHSTLRLVIVNCITVTIQCFMFLSSLPILLRCSVVVLESPAAEVVLRYVLIRACFISLNWDSEFLSST